MLATPTPDPSSLRAWLALFAAKGIGRARARRLLGVFGSATAIFEQSRQALHHVIEPDRAAALLAAHHDAVPSVERTLEWMTQAPHRHVVELDSPLFPPLLRHSPDPPLVLWAEGRWELLHRPGVAIVGSRQATAQGRKFAQGLARDLSGVGIPVVSGLALGIDAAAHEGALSALCDEHASQSDEEQTGSTVGVVAHGLDEVYPQRHRGLFSRIAEQGLVLSEYPLGTPALPEHFPLRNRIIAGSVCSLVVIEATLRSGSLITARLAAEAGRDVFAVPGPVHFPQSAGCHALIKQGAGLLDDAMDLLSANTAVFGVQHQRLQDQRQSISSTTAPPSGVPRALKALLQGPCSLDELEHRTQLPAGELLSVLLDAELSGQVSRIPGGLFQWCG